MKTLRITFANLAASLAMFLMVAASIIGFAAMPLFVAVAQDKPQPAPTPEIADTYKVKILANEKQELLLLAQRDRIDQQLAQLRSGLPAIGTAALAAAKLDPEKWQVNFDSISFEKKPEPPKPPADPPKKK